MFKKAAVVLGMLLLVPSGAQAQFIPVLEQKDMRNQQVMSGLLDAMTAKPTKNNLADVRGGNGSKLPLGQYMILPNTEFKSAYKDAPVDLQAKFAYDLHEFVKGKGKDWPTMQRNSNLDYVEYNKQNDFADFWWLRNYKTYKDLPFFFHDGFLSDALLDATNCYNWYARKDYASADYTAWGDVALRQLLNKK